MTTNRESPSRTIAEKIVADSLKEGDERDEVAAIERALDEKDKERDAYRQVAILLERHRLIREPFTLEHDEAEKQAVEVALADLERDQRVFRQQIAATATFDAVAA